MSREAKIVKGGLRATLALIISIIALILAVIAFNSVETKDDLSARIKDLQTKMEKVKRESARQIEKLRDETANTLERLGKAIKSEEGEKKP